MKTTNTLRNASFVGTALLSLSLVMPMAAQARGAAYWARSPQARAVCVKHKDGYPAGRPYRCEPTGTTTDRGVSFELPGGRGRVNF
jgi:hypothetical protein